MNTQPLRFRASSSAPCPIVQRATTLQFVLRVSVAVATVWALMLPAQSAWAKEPGFAGVINLNTATAQELERLPGVGPSKANKILEHRQRKPFRTVAELVRVKGFGAKTLQRLRPFLTVTEPTQLAASGAAPACVCPPAPPQEAAPGDIKVTR